MNISNPKRTFTHWYSDHFAWFLEQPMPQKIFYQVMLWLLYGFIWIPIWFLFCDKTIHPTDSHPVIPQQPTGAKDPAEPTSAVDVTAHPDGERSS